ncbi:MAG: peptidylprolyl isomerase [Gemmatimonadota bacterium]
MKRSFAIFMIVGVLVACEGFKKAMGSHSDTVAKAGSQELSVDRLAALLGQAKVPVTSEIAKAITNVWVDYQLLGVAAAHNDSLTDAKMIDDALWPIIAQMRAGKWHDVVVKGFHIDTTGSETKFNAGEVLAARHILLTVPQGATPAQSDSIRKVAEGVRAQVTPSNFTAMATKYTQEPGGAQRGGDLGVFPKGAMVPQFEQAVSALKPGQVSPLVKTQFGYHIIRRSTYPEVAAEVASRLNGPALQTADSTYIAQLEASGNIQFKPNAVATIKDAAKDLEAHRADKTVIATSKAGDFTVSRLTRWLEAFQQREDLGKRLQTAPDSTVLSFAKNVLRNELVLHQADSAKIELTADEMKELHGKFTQVVGASWDQLGLNPKSLADSAKSVSDREKLASTRVNAYLDKLMQQQAGFVQVPPPLELALKEKYNVTINGAAMDKAVAASTALKSKSDSLRAKNAPPTEVPMGGMQMPPQGAPAPAAPAAPAPAPAPAPPKPHN